MLAASRGVGFAHQSMLTCLTFCQSPAYARVMEWSVRQQCHDFGLYSYRSATNDPWFLMFLGLGWNKFNRIEFRLII